MRMLMVNLVLESVGTCKDGPCFDPIYVAEGGFIWMLLMCPLDGTRDGGR